MKASRHASWRVSSGDASHRLRHLGVVVALAVVFSGLSILAVHAAGTRDDVDAEGVIGLLARDPVPGDSLDLEQIPESRAPLNLDSSRRIHDEEGSVFWVLTDADGNVCLVSRQTTASSQWAAALSCAEPSVFQKHGLWLRLSVGSEGSDVTLVADGVTNEIMRKEVASFGASIPADNLVVFPLKGRPSELVVDTGLGFALDLGKPEGPGG